MAKAAAAVTTKVPVVKREPVMMASAAMTLAMTAMYVAPQFGVKIPDKVTKVASLALTLAGGLGVRMLVKPV